MNRQSDDKGQAANADSTRNSELNGALGLDGLKVYPTKFEAYEIGDAVFQVEAFDESAATVKIDTVLNVAKWDEISPLIRKCLVDMELT